MKTPYFYENFQDNKENTIHICILEFELWPGVDAPYDCTNSELTENVLIVVEVFGSVRTVHRHGDALLFNLTLEGVNTGFVIL